MKAPTRIAGLAVLAAVCVQVAAATPPTIVAKRAQAAKVLAEISAIDEQVNAISEQYDGARLRLATLRERLAAERVALAHAKVQVSRAEKRAANLLVWLYSSDHASALDVILGARSLSELLRLSDDENAISAQAATIATETSQARAVLRARVQALETDQAAARATVAQIAQRRAQIERRLSQRVALLRSVQAQVAKLEAQERARQARLAAQAASAPPEQAPGTVSKEARGGLSVIARPPKPGS
jgi:peptidoglycan hydrolase CwlO-like protein